VFKCASNHSIANEKCNLSACCFAEKSELKFARSQKNLS